MLSRLLVILFGLAALPPASALDPDKPFSQYVIDRWSVQEGFPQVSALQIVQDKTGYIWATSQSGLARFDGVRFETFEVRNTPQLLTNHLEILLVHSDGSLWIGSTRGLVVMRGEQFSVRLRSGQEVGAILALAEGTDGSVWVGAERGLFRVSETIEKILDGPVWSLKRIASGLWIGRRGRVERWANSATERFDLPDPEARVEHLDGDSDTLWIGTDHGLFRLAAGDIDPLSLDHRIEDVESLFVDRHGSVWIGGYEALVRRLPNGQFEYVGQDEMGFRPWIVSMAEDHEGNLWLGSNTHSLIRLWDGWTRRYSNREGLKDPFVWSVAADGDGGIWVGTNSGLSRYRNGRIRSVLAGDQLPDPAVYTIAAVGSDCALLGTRGGLAEYCDGRVDVPRGAGGLLEHQINGILIDDGRWWLATDDGLAYLEQGRLDWVPGFDEQAKRVRIIRMSDWGLLVGTEGGLFLLRDGAPETVGGGTPLEEAFVTAIDSLPDGRMVIGTLGRGMLVGEPDGTWLHLQDDWGLPSGAQFHLDAHRDGYLWVGGEVGAYRIRMSSIPKTAAQAPQPLAIQNLASTNRLSGSQPARCCNGAGLAKGLFMEGSFWFPTLDGVLEIQPDKIASPVGLPRVLIEGVQVGRTQSVIGGPEVELAPDQRDFSVRFTALTYQDPRNVIFRYRLRGYDENWVWAGRRRIAYYTNLKPGEYRFEVEASLGTQRWVPARLPLQVSIVPRLVETLWFKALLGLAGFLMFAVIYLMRVRESNRIRRQLEEVVQDRTQALDEANQLLREANRKLERASETDPLTGLRNRRFIQSRLNPGTDAHDRLFDPSRMPILVVLVDIDHFKQVNDLHGHPAGDEVLKQFADLLSEEVREGDAAVRWGGEEFLLLLGPTPIDRAASVVERLRRSVERHRFEFERATLIRMSCSFGAVPVAGGNDRDFDRRWALSLELADRALYAVKQGGRNGWAVVDNPDEVPVGKHAGDINSAIDQALSEDRVEVRTSRPEVERVFRKGARRRTGGIQD